MTFPIVSNVVIVTRYLMNAWDYEFLSLIYDFSVELNVCCIDYVIKVFASLRMHCYRRCDITVVILSMMNLNQPIF